MCEYCNDNYNEQQRLLNHHGSGFTIEISDSDLDVEYSEPWHGNRVIIPINYCPMCGRKLKEETL